MTLSDAHCGAHALKLGFSQLLSITGVGGRDDPARRLKRNVGYGCKRPASRRRATKRREEVHARPE
jgi:hypothetical protein